MGGVSLVRIKIFALYLPQIRAKLKLARELYRLAQWELLQELDLITCNSKISPYQAFSSDDSKEKDISTSSQYDANCHVLRSEESTKDFKINNSPSLAEGARGWVESTKDFNNTESYTIKSMQDSKEKYVSHSLNMTDSSNALNISIRTLKESFLRTGRLDSEYYQAKYDKNEAVIKTKNYARLGDLVMIKKSIEPGSEAYKEIGIPFVRVSNLSKFEISKSDVFLSNEDFTESSLQSLQAQKDTILFSKDGSIGIAYCMREKADFITSGAILHLHIKEKTKVLTQYLTLILNSIFTKLQAERDSGGSIISHWKIDEIKEVLIPLLDTKIQEKIEAKIQKSFELRDKSKALLESAKVKVENMIKQSKE